MSGGGKGGGSTQQQEIPDWVRDPSIRNLARSEQLQQVDYSPWSGPDLASTTPTQMAAMQNNLDAANAFGLRTPQGGAMAGMPKEQVFAGGQRGYSGLGLYDQAIDELRRRDPNQADLRKGMFGKEIV